MQRPVRIIESGVVDAGFMTMVLPTAKPGPRYSEGMTVGKFQGVMTAMTPYGSRKVSTRLAGSRMGMMGVSMRTTSSAASWKLSAVSSTSGSASPAYGLPCSTVST